MEIPLHHRQKFGTTMDELVNLNEARQMHTADRPETDGACQHTAHGVCGVKPAAASNTITPAFFEMLFVNLIVRLNSIKNPML